MLCASLPTSLRSAACAQQKIKVPPGAPNRAAYSGVALMIATGPLPG
jgi:hypothetical protein